MQIKEAFGEDADRQYATGKDRPHQEAALLDILDHGTLLTPFTLGGKTNAPYLTRTFLRRNVGTSRSWPSTMVGSLFSNRPRVTGSNCITSCLTWTFPGFGALIV